MKLILFGGVKGVGKTTILSWLKNKFKGQIKLLDPGELFRRYFYFKKIKTTEEVEELIVSKLVEMPNDSVVVVHWHYAVWRPSGYIPQISFSRLKKIAESGRVEKAVLLLMEAPVDIVRERRLKNYRTKKRSLSRSTIKEEIAAEVKFLAKERLLLSWALGNHKVIVFRLTNTDLRITKLLLGNFFKSLLA